MNFRDMKWSPIVIAVWVFATIVDIMVGNYSAAIGSANVVFAWFIIWANDIL